LHTPLVVLHQHHSTLAHTCTHYTHYKNKHQTHNIYQAQAFALAFKDLAEALDEFEGGEGSSRGDDWLLSVGRFHEAAQANAESASAACLDALRARHGVAQESLAGIKKLTDRETDLRSYERRVAEGKAKANPKPEFIAKFTTKQENAMADVQTMTASVQSDLRFMESTRLSAHQPAFDQFCSALANMAAQAGQLLEPPAAGGSKSGGLLGSAKSMFSSAKSSLPSVPAMPDFSGVGAGAGMAAAGMAAKGGGAGGAGVAAAAAVASGTVAIPSPNTMSKRPMPSVPDLPAMTPKPAGPPATSNKVPPERKSLAGSMSTSHMKDRLTSAGNTAAKGLATGAAAASSAVSSAAASMSSSSPPNKQAPLPPSRSVPPLPAKPEAAAVGSEQSGTKMPAAIAKFPFVPEAEDELKLAKGDEIFDMIKVEDDWYRGTLKDGTSGIFPANYVNIL
jgi:hypothetical protein